MNNDYYKVKGQQIKIWLSYKKELDIINHLRSQNNKRDYIINLIRKDIKKDAQ